MDPADPLADHQPDGIAVSLVYCAAPGQVDEVPLRVPAGTTLAQALQASGLLQRHTLLLQDPQGQPALQVGIWGRMQGYDTLLRERDRVEIYRPLQVDPKEARRLRYGRHKAAVQARKDRLAAAALLKPEPAAGEPRPQPRLEG